MPLQSLQTAGDEDSARKSLALLNHRAANLRQAILAMFYPATMFPRLRSYCSGRIGPTRQCKQRSAPLPLNATALTATGICQQFRSRYLRFPCCLTAAVRFLPCAALRSPLRLETCCSTTPFPDREGQRRLHVHLSPGISHSIDTPNHRQV
jgi:hypothetical protein